MGYEAYTKNVLTSRGKSWYACAHLYLFPVASEQQLFPNCRRYRQPQAFGRSPLDVLTARCVKTGHLP